LPNYSVVGGGVTDVAVVVTAVAAVVVVYS